MKPAPVHPPTWMHAQTVRPANFSRADYPVLLHGTPASSASLGAAGLVAVAVAAEHRVVVLSTQRRDIRLLQAQLGLGQPAATSQAVSEPAMQTADDHLLVTLTYPAADQLLEALRSLPDWSQRLVVVLGAEHTLTQSVWQVIQTHADLVVCGDFHRLRFAFDRSAFKTIIGFSTWPDGWPYRRPNLPVYVGVTSSSEQEFIILR